MVEELCLFKYLVNAQVYHAGLTSLQSQDIERIQKRVLRIIAPDLYYEDALATFKLPSLKERLELHCIELIKRMSSPLHKLHYLLPEKLETFGKEELDTMAINFIILNVEQTVLKKAHWFM